jgi:hypothetical protein
MTTMTGVAMKSSAAGLPPEIPEGWARHCRAILREREIDEDNYQNKLVKERLMDSMATPCILALIENAGALADVDPEEPLRRLALNRRTVNRWLNGEVQAHARTFFGLLIVGLRREIDDVTLPDSTTVIWEAVSRTVAIIREKELGRSRALPRREDFACVRELMQDPRADELLPPDPGEEERDRAAADALIGELQRLMIRRFPGGMIRSARDIVSAVGEWAEAYVLFRLGLLWDWEFLDEDAV